MSDNENVLKLIGKIKAIFGDAIFQKQNKKQLISAVMDFSDDEDNANFLIEKINADDYAINKSILIKMLSAKTQSIQTKTKNVEMPTDYKKLFETMKSKIKDLDKKYNELSDKFDSLEDEFNALKNGAETSIPLVPNTNNDLKESYLKSIVEIKQNTFEKFGLKLTDYSFSDVDKDCFDFNCIIKGKTFEELCLTIKIRIYGENNLHIYTWDTLILRDNFTGYDNIKRTISYDNITLKAKKIVVFLTAE